jgi:hypothetical protein
MEVTSNVKGLYPNADDGIFAPVTALTGVT